MPSLAPAPPTKVIADLFHARRTGPGRYQARCPGPMHTHGDRSPSLAICEGNGGRVLVHCHAGCATGDVLHAVGLTWADLHAGPLRSPVGRAALAGARAERDAAVRRLHWLHGQGCDRLLALESLLHSLGARLIWMLDSDEADRLTSQYHQTLDEIRRLEPLLVWIERWFG